MIKPLGFYVLIKMPDVEVKSAGGIILDTITSAKEADACQTGEVIAFGPTAYVGWEGCKPAEGSDKKPHQLWGVEVGDKVEFKKFEGQKSIEAEGYRYIPDSHLVGVVE